MASMSNFCFVSICIFHLFANLDCQFLNYKTAIPLVNKDECTQAGNNTKQFYDATKLACVSCSQTESFQIVSADGLSCICQAGYRYDLNNGGTQVTCAKCADDEVSSSTGYNCVKCPNGKDPTTNTCNGCSSTEISPERDLLGNLYTTPTCQNCSAGTIPDPDNNRCVKCLSTYPITNNNTCCPSGYVPVSGYCFPSADFDGVNVNDDAKYIIPGTVTAVSQVFQDNLLRAYAQCYTYKNSTACQVIGNLCVLTFYEYSITALPNGPLTTACEMYLKPARDENNFAPLYAPWLYFMTRGLEKEDGDDVLFADVLTTPYTLDPPSNIEYRVARYSLDGQYLGLDNVMNGRIQLCADTTAKLNAAFLFGTYYKQTCSIAAIDFWNQNKYPLEFLDPYLEMEVDGVKQLYPIPVDILNYRSVQDNYETINRGDAAEKYLFRRFFLVDNVGNIPAGGGQAGVVRYAKSITINVALHSGTTQGNIYPPALSIDYGTISLDDANEGAKVDITFTVDYTYDPDNYKRDFRIAIGVLSALGVVYAGYKTWCWSKRSGRPSLDFATIANFFFFCAGSLANVFFVVTFGMAFYWFIFFKRQTVVFLVHPTDSQLKDWLGLFGSAFALKFLEVAHLIFLQCIVDVFFIDWERSRGVVSNSAETTRTKEVPVSIWRTYFVANEWNEIQAVRKINKTFQVWAAVFFLVVVGFENTATKDPDGSVNKDDANYKAEYSKVYRYAVAVMVYIIIGVIQWIFFTFIYERFFEDKVRQFVDLCSMSNISVFIMSHAQYGYYIHGRSVHGKADTNMKEMFELMKKEEEDMCGQRGLLPNTEQQTFAMALPRKLRQRYEAVLLPAQLESAAAASRMEAAGKGGRIIGTAMEKQVEAYCTINRFLSAFIDRSLKDVDYVIKDKSMLENIMDTEFDETYETGVFYNDNGHSFDSALFYGNEMTLMLFDVLTFCVSDLIFQNYVIAGVITYLMSEFVCFCRKSLPSMNNLFRPFSLWRGAKPLDAFLYKYAFEKRNNLDWSAGLGLVEGKRTLPTRLWLMRDSLSRAPYLSSR